VPEVVAQFSAEAWIVGGGFGHSRFYDHFGTQPDTNVVLSGAIGKYPSGMTVHAILTDVLARIEALENGAHRVYALSASAWIAYNWNACAVIFSPGGGINKYPLSVNAEIGGPLRSFVVDALLTQSPVLNFSAAAYKIDQVS
jgi:hypothetical protein